MGDIIIRKAVKKDHDWIWKIIRQVICTADTYVFPPDSDRNSMLDYWCGEDKYTYVATIEGGIVGTFSIKDNQPGLGAHVANASFMTLPTAFGKGIGKAMGIYALSEAKRLGYMSMQFNIVVKNNARAVSLWKKLGFEIIGEIPEAFKHPEYGLINAYIMWRKL